MPRLWPNGIGESLGDLLVTETNLTTSGKVFFVSSIRGNDTNTGGSQDTAWATLNNALTGEGAVVNDSTIVLLAGHTETISTAITTSLTGLTLVGAGSSGGIPTVTLTMNTAGNTGGIISTGAGFRFMNIYVTTRGTLSTAPSVSLKAANSMVRGCYFESGANDGGGSLGIDANVSGIRIVNTTFTSVATSVATQGQAGLFLTTVCSDLELSGVVCDASTNGFIDVGINLNQTVTRLRGESISLLRGADMAIGSNSTGYVLIPTSTGGAKVEW